MENFAKIEKFLKFDKNFLDDFLGNLRKNVTLINLLGTVYTQYNRPKLMEHVKEVISETLK